MRTAKQKFDIRKSRVRYKISKVSNRLRLSVFKSNQHLYAQIIDDTKSITLVSASSVEKDLKAINKSNCNIKVAHKIGKIISDRALAAGIKQVVFDKGGNKYHGVIKALADAARENLEF